MSETQVKVLEDKIGVMLPQSYRVYLTNSEDKFLDQAIIFKPPRSGVIDELLTVGDVLANDAAGQIGIPERSLMHIGGNLMGGYLYLDVSDQGFGRIHYMENYTMKETFPSFDDLLAEPREELEE
ncbi:MAG: hypothetical protein SynsKO_45280 [Synoicihabitans sp.]